MNREWGIVGQFLVHDFLLPTPHFFNFSFCSTFMRMSTKPNTPKGMRDFLPHEVMRRNHIMGVMKTQFERLWVFAHRNARHGASRAVVG